MDYNYIVLGIFSIISNIDKEKCSEEYLEKYKDLLYPTINSDFINKDSKIINEIQSMLKDFVELINKNPVQVVSYLSKLLKKD